MVTGTRAEYGLLKPVMMAIQEHPNLNLEIVVAGMHLERQFGHSIDEILADGFEVNAQVPMTVEGDSGKGMALSVSMGIQGFTEVFDRIRPDCVVVLGDRTEILAAVISALFLNIPIAHIHGGDVTRGGTDESVRHAVTKMAHIHFPATPKSAERILQMGEDDWRVFCTGAPCLDTILHFQPITRHGLASKLGLPVTGDFFVLVQHSVSTEPDESRHQIQETLFALDQLKIPTVAIYPNSDAGGLAIIDEFTKWKTSPWLQVFTSLPQELYLSALKNCACLIGNSSSGMIESASFQIPVLNLGIRQEGRERGANVKDLPHDRHAIEQGLNWALMPATRTSMRGIVNPYGGGDTGKRIAEILSQVELGKKLMQKKLTCA